jgi:hypothetical protein
MRLRPLLLTLTLSAIAIFASALPIAHAQSYVKYQVQISPEGSAAWTIIQASDLTGTIDSWRGFQQRVDNLVSSTVIQTQREMSLDPDSLQLNTVWENQSQTTEYQFTWLNFSINQDGQLAFGDVFHLNSFFSQLYGDGELQIIYPSNYTVSSVSPQPNGGSTAPYTLDWLGTQFFVNGNPNIVLMAAEPSPTPNNGLNLQLVALAGAVLAIAAALFGFFLFRRRQNQRRQAAQPNIRVAPPIVESEEEKILRVLQANGGSAFQSAVTEQCRFSKSKTSQLLTALEKKGLVTRYKKGRDKIVNLTEKCKGASP